MSPSTGGAGKVALITGASSGIGYELAKLFARDRVNLVLIGRDVGQLEQLAGELQQAAGVTVTVLPTDLSRSAAAREVFEELLSRAIAIDFLVNDAGFGVYGSFAKTELERELDLMQVNVIALLQLTKLILPTMLERGTGKILNVASTAAFVPGPFEAVYSASKAFVLSFSESLAEECRDTGVSVTALCPGPTKTKFAERANMADTKLFRRHAANPAEVAEAGYQAMMQGRTRVVAGTGNKLMTFSLRFAPRTAVAKVCRELLSPE